MPHRPNTWTDALFIYPLYHVNFLTSFMEWFRFFFQWRDSENRELRSFRDKALGQVPYSVYTRGQGLVPRTIYMKGKE